MDAQKTTDQKPTRQDLLDAWAAYEAAQTAAEMGGWEFDLSLAASEAYAAYDKMNQRIKERGVKP